MTLILMNLSDIYIILIVKKSFCFQLNKMAAKSNKPTDTSVANPIGPFFL